MPRWSLFLIFFGVAMLVLGSVHYYFFRRLVVGPALPLPWRTVAKIALLVLALSFPLSFWLARGLDVSVGKLILYPLYIWLGTMMILFFVLLSLDLIRGIAWIGLRFTASGPPNPERRLFLARLAAGVASGVTLTAAGTAVAQGLGRLVTKRLDVTLPGLPAALDGFTIAQLTDLHLSAMRHGTWVREVVARTNALKPDLIAITGDLADATPGQLAAEVQLLQQLKAPHGVFFVTGNHEYFIALHDWLAQLEAIGIRVLRNERVTIERDGASFELAGVDDHEGRRFHPDHGPDLARAMRGHDPQRASVLLAHQPRIIGDAAAHRVGLVLSGHTHGGQIWPWNYLVYLQQPFVSGLHERDGTQIYVSEGTGFWGPPMRLGSTAEITLVSLRSPTTRSA